MPAECRFAFRANRRTEEGEPPARKTYPNLPKPTQTPEPPNPQTPEPPNPQTPEPPNPRTPGPQPAPVSGH
ncbi:hypothetical protein EYF80_067465 [Liparis tanakae]|uniref:Uncharacterized protein n=1 Tax=Liparis tanakae TaxID=230148 RepID=A0A4Z2E0V3_9TELE|nr:hypothetical protein EYF80_067465 [Liparis tanakae]